MAFELYVGEIMQTVEYKLSYTTTDEATEPLPVIIVAAGSSLRMQGVSKQFLLINGIPAIVHTLLAFQNSPKISNIVLVTKDEFIPQMQLLVSEYDITKLSDIVEGGKTRQESVKNGLECIKNNNFVLIHDGARPMVTEEVIARVCDELISCDAVICAVKVKDTIKRVDGDSFVLETLKRDELISVQTPQGVNLQKYKEALKTLDCADFTDDASIMEAAGYKVKLVEGDYSNIKITTPEDTVLAEYYLKKRGAN